MSKLRSIDTIIWTDTWFEELCAEEKLLFIYLITNDKTNMLGVYEVSIRKISFDTSISTSNVEKYLKRFENDKKILYKHNNVVLLNFLKHQKYNPNMMKSAIECYNNLPKELKISGLDMLSKDKKGFESLSNGFGMVRKVEVEVEVEKETKEEEEVLLEKETKYTNRHFKNDLVNYGFNKDLVDEWMQVRKNKRATNSKTALNKFINQVELNGNDKNFILETCIAKSWGSFEASYNLGNVTNKVIAPNNQVSKQIDPLEYFGYELNPDYNVR